MTVCFHLTKCVWYDAGGEIYLKRFRKRADFRRVWCASSDGGKGHRSPLAVSYLPMPFGSCIVSRVNLECAVWNCAGRINLRASTIQARKLSIPSCCAISTSLLFHHVAFTSLALTAHFVSRSLPSANTIKSTANCDPEDFMAHWQCILN